MIEREVIEKANSIIFVIPFSSAPKLNQLILS